MKKRIVCAVCAVIMMGALSSCGAATENDAVVPPPTAATTVATTAVDEADDAAAFRNGIEAFINVKFFSDETALDAFAPQGIWDACLSKNDGVTMDDCRAFLADNRIERNHAEVFGVGAIETVTYVVHGTTAASDRTNTQMKSKAAWYKTEMTDCAEVSLTLTITGTDGTTTRDKTMVMYKNGDAYYAAEAIDLVEKLIDQIG